MRSASSQVFSWWELWPARYEAELEAFRQKGATTTETFKENGVLILEVAWPKDDGGSLKLQVGFAALHPFFRPIVIAPDLTLARHQNPFNKALCLLTQGTGEWEPGEHVADLIARQLPQIQEVLALRQDARWEDAAKLEEAAPDPLSPYYSGFSEPDSAILFRDPPRVPPGSCGVAEFDARPLGSGRLVEPFQAVLRKVKPLAGDWFAQAFESPGGLRNWERLQGRWVRLSPPFDQDARTLLARAEEVIARAAKPGTSAARKMAQAQEAALCITAVSFDEERAYGEKAVGSGWLFLARRRGTGLDRQDQVSFVRGLRVTGDLHERLPVAKTLKGKKVLVLGCGAIGSFVVLELARAGVGQLIIVDPDRVEPGNGVRWPMGRGAWGLRKTHALASFVAQNYPSTIVTEVSGEIGIAMASPDDARKSGHEVEQLRQLIADADVVVDTTASLECRYALAYHARDLGKPYILGYATYGAAGGVVARIRPDAPFCPLCLEAHWKGQTLPEPPVDASGTVLPVGCNAPTFTGGAFDLQEVSLEVVRTTIGVLCADPETFDPGDWDLAVLSHRADSRRMLPTWEGKVVEPHPDCPFCSPKAA